MITARVMGYAIATVCARPCGVGVTILANIAPLTTPPACHVRAGCGCCARACSSCVSVLCACTYCDTSCERIQGVCCLLCGTPKAPPSYGWRGSHGARRCVDRLMRAYVLRVYVCVPHDTRTAARYVCACLHCCTRDARHPLYGFYTPMRACVCFVRVRKSC